MLHKTASYVPFKNVFPKFKLNLSKAPAREFSKELFNKLIVIGLQFWQAGPPNMNWFQGSAKTISFLFYIFETYKFSLLHLWNL